MKTMTRENIACLSQRKVAQPSPQVTLNDARWILFQVLDTIGEALEKGEKVSLPHFGVFYTQHRPERQGRNPRQPGMRVTIPARISARFKASKQCKARIQKGMRA